MAEQFDSERRGRGFASTVGKKAVAPVVTALASAGGAYLVRKANEAWQQRLQPKVQQKGGGRAVVRELLENAAGKVGGPTSNKLKELAANIGDSTHRAAPSQAEQAEQRPASDENREEERRQREQRRRARRRALEQSGPK